MPCDFSKNLVAGTAKFIGVNGFLAGKGSWTWGWNSMPAALQLHIVKSWKLMAQEWTVTFANVWSFSFKHPIWDRHISKKSMSFSVPCLIESPTSVSYSRFPTSSFPTSFQITNLKTRCSEMDLSETTLSRQFSAAEIQVLVPVGCRLCLWGIGFFIMIAFWCVSFKSFPSMFPDWWWLAMATWLWDFEQRVCYVF